MDGDSRNREGAVFVGIRIWYNWGGMKEGGGEDDGSPGVY
jgi:hypothetical protein